MRHSLLDLPHRFWVGLCLLLTFLGGCRTPSPPPLRDIGTGGMPESPAERPVVVPPAPVEIPAVAPEPKKTDDKKVQKLSGRVKLERVTAFKIDPIAAAIDFTAVVRNKLRDTVYLKEVSISGVRLVRDDQPPVAIGTGSGTTTEQIEPVAGSAAIPGVAFVTGESEHTFRVALPRDPSAMAANLVEIFNALIGGTSDAKTSLLFSMRAKGGVAASEGIEWVEVGAEERFEADFGNLVRFESAESSPDVAFAGTLVISRVESGAIVTDAGGHHFEFVLSLVNRSEKDTIVLRKPTFSSLAFFRPGHRVTIGTGEGHTPEKFVPTEGFPAENGMELPPGMSQHSIHVAMAADEAAALQNLVEILNVLGSPEMRADVCLLFIVRTGAGVKTPEGPEAFTEIEAYKSLKANVKRDYLFK